MTAAALLPSRRSSVFRPVLLAGLGMGLGLSLLAGCGTTEHGRREVDSRSSSNQGITTEAYQAPDIGGPQEIQTTPTEPVKPIVPASSYSHSLVDSGAGVAVQSLWRQAQTALNAGKLDQAASYLTRAIRIEPRNAWVWESLAQVHLAQRQYDQAENETQKSNSFDRNNPYLQAANLQIIASIRDAKGDAAAALQARAQADALVQNAGSP